MELNVQEQDVKQESRNTKFVLSSQVQCLQGPVSATDLKAEVQSAGSAVYIYQCLDECHTLYWV